MMVSCPRRLPASRSVRGQDGWDLLVCAGARVSGVRVPSFDGPTQTCLYQKATSPVPSLPAVEQSTPATGTKALEKPPADRGWHARISWSTEEAIVRLD